MKTNEYFDKSELVLKKVSAPISMFTTITSSQQVLLQWIALVVMTLDHYVLIFHDSSHWLHDFSRFVYPVFAYLVTYNYLYRTSNKTKYLSRLFVWACISQPVYSWALDVSYYRFNILFTLFFGLVFIFFYEHLKTRYKTKTELVIGVSFCLFLIFLVMGIFVSYYWFGMLLIFSFFLYFTYPSLISLSLLAISLVLLNIVPEGLINGLYALSFFVVLFASVEINKVVKISKLPGWLFYAYYPLHFAILGIVVGRIIIQ